LAQFFSIHPTHPQARLIRRAAQIVRGGGLIAYPTDSSYALGCHLGDAQAQERLRRRVRRHAHADGLAPGVLQPARHFARRAQDEGIAARRRQLEHAELRVADDGVGRDLRQVAAHEREVVLVVHAAHAPQALLRVRVT